MNQYLGFSWKGFLVVMLPMLPNILFFLYPDAITSGNTVKSHQVLDIIEHGSQVIFIAFLLFYKSKQEVPFRSNYVLGMLIFLVSYYVLWVLLFGGKKSLIVLLCMAIFPVIYFIFAEIWLHNYIAIIFTMIFGFVHVMITYMDYQSAHT